MSDAAAGGAPLLPYDPFSFRLHEDPYPTYGWMREHEPLHRNDALDLWALSRYDDVSAALRRPALFSSRNGISVETDLWGQDPVRTSSFLAMDPPEHRAVRSLVQFMSKGPWVAALAPRIRELARDRLELLVGLPLVDVAADFASALPNDVMCEAMGIPPDDWDLIRAENDLLNSCEDGIATRSRATVDAGVRLAAYYVDLVADRRRRPRDDLTSVLVSSRVDGRPLDDGAVVALLFLLVSATNESTGKLIGNAWYHARGRPRIQQQGLAGRAVAWMDETLRFDSPSQMTARLITQDTLLHGTLVPAGSRVALLPASANRDGRVFERPDDFDLDRDTSRHIAFGLGPHFCLGAALARLEITIALEELARVAESYEVDDDRVVRAHSPHQRGFASLPSAVCWRGHCRP